MCGIVGYIGSRNAYPILINGLKRLEYRGYDSAGVALINDKGQLNVYKEKGKVSNLEAIAAQRDTFHLPKGHLLHAKRPPFATQNMVFYKAADLQAFGNKAT